MPKTKEGYGSNPKFSKEEILKILDDTIQNFPSSDKYFTYGHMLNIKGLYPQYMNYYINDLKDPDIVERIKILKVLQKSKLENGILYKGSGMRENAGMFILKCKHGYIEEDRRQANEIAREKIKHDDDIDGIGTTLDINFNVIEHRSEEDIQKLIDESEK